MTKRAVLIGINGYRDETVSDLAGCLNDVELMADVLTTNYDFPDANVERIVDPANGRDDILHALDRLVDATEMGDIVVIYYSGHGSQVPDVGGDEPDGMDETIVPSDSGRGQLENRDIVDDELDSFVVALTELTNDVTFVFDSCHSGSVDRSLLSVPLLAMPARRAIPPAEVPPVDGPHLRPETVEHAKGPRSASGLLPQGRHVLIAGCLDNQTSKETTLGGRRHGALTYYLAEGLRATDATLQSAFRHASDCVRKTVEAQQPVIEGPLELIQAPAFRPLVAEQPTA